MKRTLIGLFFLLFLFFHSFSFAAILENQTTINRINLPASASVKVSGFVGGYLFDIEGLTSPWARVEFSSTQGNINLETIADSEGVFRFYNALIARETGDLCFTSIDVKQRASSPLCFSPPAARTKTTIRGIVLPPTLSLEKELFRQGETSGAEGMTTPNSPVRTFLFEDENTSIWQFIDATLPGMIQGKKLLKIRAIKPAWAREGPPLIITSDEKGEFVFNLPTYKSTVWKLFVGTQRTQYGENPSPQSNTIQFAALSWWQWLLLQILLGLISLINFLGRLFINPLFIIVLLITSIIIIAKLLISRNNSSREGKRLIKR